MKKLFPAMLWKEKKWMKEIQLLEMFPISMFLLKQCQSETTVSKDFVPYS